MDYSNIESLSHEARKLQNEISQLRNTYSIDFKSNGGYNICTETNRELIEYVLNEVVEIKKIRLKEINVELNKCIVNK